MVTADFPFNWHEELERLRREQNPGRYPSSDNRPALHIPVPEPPPCPSRSSGDEAPEEPTRGSIILDL